MNQNASENVATPRQAAPASSPIGWGAAVIDEQGNETPITESMIERACAELAADWLFPRPRYAPAG